MTSNRIETGKGKSSTRNVTLRRMTVISFIAVLAALVMVVVSCSTALTTSTIVTPAAAVKLVFTTQPAGASAGSLLITQPVVTAEDANGNIVTSNIIPPVILSIIPGTGTTGAKIFGGTTVIPVKGVATFQGLSINLVGTGYKLLATSSGLASATSDAFNITPGAAAKLVFSTQLSRP
jgi:hypothetical protein